VWSDDWLAYGGARYLFVTDADRRHDEELACRGRGTAARASTLRVSQLDRRHDLNHDDASRACRRLNSHLVSVGVSRMSTLTDTRFGRPACE